MGLSIFSNSTEVVTKDTETTPNPNKFAFKVCSITKGELYDFVRVNYSHCTTFDGDKLLLVHKGSVTFDMDELDPHFFEDGFIVARFPATDEGEALAMGLRNGFC